MGTICINHFPRVISYRKHLKVIIQFDFVWSWMQTEIGWVEMCTISKFVKVIMNNYEPPYFSHRLLRGQRMTSPSGPKTEEQ